MDILICSTVSFTVTWDTPHTQTQQIWVHAVEGMQGTFKTFLIKIINQLDIQVLRQEVVSDSLTVRGGWETEHRVSAMARLSSQLRPNQGKLFFPEHSDGWQVCVWEMGTSWRAVGFSRAWTNRKYQKLLQRSHGWILCVWGGDIEDPHVSPLSYHVLYFLSNLEGNWLSIYAMNMQTLQMNIKVRSFIR